MRRDMTLEHFPTKVDLEDLNCCLRKLHHHCPAWILTPQPLSIDFSHRELSQAASFIMVKLEEVEDAYFAGEQQGAGDDDDWDTDSGKLPISFTIRSRSRESAII